jgi:hypothetical protein
MTPSYLIYHPTRQPTIIGKLTVHHDKFGGNEDPYIWHDNFLHTYCHITQLKNVEGQINFWISGDTYPNFNQLFCDCVFVIDKKYFWTHRNSIDRSDPIVDNGQTFEHHYKWVNPPDNHHHYKKRRRYTLKADSKKSFQPQDNNGNLIGISDFLNDNGITIQQLRSSISFTRTDKKARNSRPFELPDNLGQKLYDYLLSKATVKLFGKQLKNKHPSGQSDNKNCC